MLFHSEDSCGESRPRNGQEAGHGEYGGLGIYDSGALVVLINLWPVTKSVVFSFLFGRNLSSENMPGKRVVGIVILWY